MLIRKLKLIFKFYIKSNIVILGIIASFAAFFIGLVGDANITVTNYNFATIFKLFTYPVLLYFVNIEVQIILLLQ